MMHCKNDEVVLSYFWQSMRARARRVLACIFGMLLNGIKTGGKNEKEEKKRKNRGEKKQRIKET